MIVVEVEDLQRNLERERGRQAEKVEERGYKVYRVQKPVILDEYCCLAGGRY
jgi:hypothetical protein